MAIALYLFWGGPLWRSDGEGDFTRIAVSYAVIPLLTAALLWSPAQGRWSRISVASGVLVACKLVITTLLALGLAG